MVVTTLLAVASSCVLTALVGGCAPPEGSSPGARRSAPVAGLAATIAAVVDGNTIRVDVGGSTETVRLLGIDTPETPGGPRPAECFGPQASQFAQELLPPGTTVLLTRDVESRDQFGRLLAYVHRGDGLFVNLAMVENGFATALFIGANTSVRAEFVDAANRARREWIGFWPACGAADIVLAPEDEGDGG